MEAQDEYLIKIPFQIDLDLLLTKDESVCTAGEEPNGEWKALRRISNSVMPVISQFHLFTFKNNTNKPDVEIGGYYVRDPSTDLTTKITPGSPNDEIWIKLNALQANAIDGKPKRVLARSVTRNSPVLSSCDVIGEIVTAPAFEDEVKSMKNNEESASNTACESSFSMAKRVWDFENFAGEWDKHNLCEGDKTDSTDNFDESLLLPTPKKVKLDRQYVTNPVLEHYPIPGENLVLEQGKEPPGENLPIETVEDVSEEQELFSSNSLQFDLQPSSQIHSSNQNSPTLAEKDALPAVSPGKKSNESEQNELLPRLDTTNEKIDGSKKCKEIGGQEDDGHLAVRNVAQAGTSAAYFRNSVAPKLRLSAPSVHPNSQFKRKLIENMNLNPPSSFIRLKFDEFEGSKKKTFLALPVAGTSRDGPSIPLAIDNETTVHLYPLNVSTTPLRGLYKAIGQDKLKNCWLSLPTNNDFQLLKTPISKPLRNTAMTVIAEKMNPPKK
jgi:hypothetical protein